MRLWRALRSSEGRCASSLFRLRLIAFFWPFLWFQLRELHIFSRPSETMEQETKDLCISSIDVVVEACPALTELSLSRTQFETASCRSSLRSLENLRLSLLPRALDKTLPVAIISAFPCLKNLNLWHLPLPCYAAVAELAEQGKLRALTKWLMVDNDTAGVQFEAAKRAVLACPSLTSISLDTRHDVNIEDREPLHNRKQTFPCEVCTCMQVLRYLMSKRENRDMILS